MKRLLAILALFTLSACGPEYQMALPTTFKRYEDRETYRAITAEGVMLAVREVKNYPEASLAFWVDALRSHQEKRGAVLADQVEFRVQTGHAAHTLDFVVPHGAEDWILSETVVVVDDRVVLVEAAGPFARFQASKPALRQALLTFNPDA